MFDISHAVPVISVVAYAVMMLAVLVAGDLSRPVYRWLLVYLSILVFWTATLMLPEGFTDTPLVRSKAPYVTILMAALLGGLVSTFLQRKRMLWWWVLSAFVLGASLLFELVCYLFPGQMVLPRKGVQLLLVLSGWSAYMCVALILTLRACAGTRHASRLIHAYSLLVAVLLLAVGDSLYIADGFHFNPLAVTFKAAGASIITYSLVSSYVPDLGYVVRRSVRYLIFALLILLLLGISVLATQLLLGFNAKSLALSMVVASLLISAVYEPLYTFIRRLAGKVRFGKGRSSGHEIRGYGLAIANILSAEEMAVVAIGTISELLEVSTGSLLLVNQDETGRMLLRPIQVIGQVPHQAGVFQPDSPLLRLFNTRGAPMAWDDVEVLRNLRETRAEEREWLEELGMNLYVPIGKGKEPPVGFFALGPKHSGQPYSAGDIDILTTLAAQTVVALENVRLVENLRALNEEVSTLNAELQRTNRALTHRDKTKFDFIQIASHELKTPLTLVRGYADMLDSLGSNELSNRAFIREATRGILASTSRMTETIEAMLDVARLDADALALQITSVSVESVVRLAIDDLASALLKRNLHIRCEGLAALPRIKADGQRLHQALFHVLNNAVKFTPDGGRISVAGQMLESDRNAAAPFLQLVIRDSGIGINPEEKELIFETFYRASDPALHSTGKTKFKGGGPGLGLTIVKGIIESHGGRVWVESKGQDERELPGTAFFIILPLDAERGLPGYPAGKSAPDGS